MCGILAKVVYYKQRAELTFHKIAQNFAVPWHQVGVSAVHKGFVAFAQCNEFFVVV